MDSPSFTSMETTSAFSYKSELVSDMFTDTKDDKKVESEEVETEVTVFS